MKMENEFKAGRDGTVSKVPVKEGDVVDTHQLLVAFKSEK
jgi:biotin carboxyl carrier protein